jgi:uncharacterized protein (DUF58 family)
VLTRSGWLVTAAGIAMLVAGRALGITELFLTGTTVLVLPLVALVWVRRPAPALTSSRTVRPARVPLGGRSRVEISVVNHGRRRSPVVGLVDPVEGTVGARLTLGPLRGGHRHDAAYRLPTDRRGLRHIGPMRAELTDPFGLARRTRTVAGPAHLTVLPAVETLAGMPLGAGRDEPMVGAVRRATNPGSTDDFATLRPYVPGDDLRRVHWPSTARAGDLLVREDDTRWQGHVMVVLDTREDRLDAAAFEAAVSAAASVVVAAGRNGDRVRLLMTDGTDSGLVLARAATDRMLEHLAMATRSPSGGFPLLPDDGRHRTGTLVVVTGPARADDLFAIAAARPAFGATVLVTVGRDDHDERPATPPGVEMVALDPAQRFAPRWDAALARMVRRSHR